MRNERKLMNLSCETPEGSMSKGIKIVVGLLISGLFGVVVVSLVLSGATGGSFGFFTTSSPSGTYEVRLTGRQGRPALGLTNEVRFDVLKNGHPFISNAYLHSADSFDLSFEAGYPNHGWLSENILHLYREQYFRKGRPDTLVVTNKTQKTIRYLRVQSIDKFLLFDLETSSSVELSTSPPRGDIKWIGAEGEFSNGQKIELKGVNFKTRQELGSAFIYYINITDHGLTIESPHLETYEPE
jgi:hypothetical protein